MIDPKQVHETLGRYQLVDGFPFVVDLDASKGPWLSDARTGKKYFDAEWIRVSPEQKLFS